MNEMNNRIGNLDRRVDRVGAGAAALAALHPLEFSPEAKWDISAGIGNYRGASAVAIGAFYRPNVNTLVSIGSSYGGGENMINAGVNLPNRRWRNDQLPVQESYGTKDYGFRIGCISAER